MGADVAAERSAAATSRLRELMERSRRWRAAHPAQAPVPPGGLPSREKRQAERAKLDEFEAGMAALGAPGPTFPVPVASTLQHVVTGELREQLLDWLPTVTEFWLTDGELAALGDAASGQAERLVEVLADEGFEHVHVARLNERYRAQLWVHPRDGLLAEVVEMFSQLSGGSWETEIAGVHGCVEVLDAELLSAGVHLTNLVHVPGTGERTRFERVTMRLYLPRMVRSLRAQLAALRVAARPALPWPAPGLDSWIGPDSLGPVSDFDGKTSPSSEAATLAALAELPARVHDLFGPNLMAW